MRADDLRAARKAKSWTVTQLIHALNKAAEPQGIRLMSPASLKVAISRWENGHTKPDDLHSRLLAEVLDIPQTSAVLDRGLEYQQDPAVSVSLLYALADSDIHNDATLLSTPTQTAFDAQVVTGYLFAHSPALEPESFGAIRSVLMAERIRQTAAAMMASDFEHGGGHVRRALLNFFRAEVVPQLKAYHPEHVRREIFSAAAEVTQLLGWSAYDAGRHQAAVRYFVQGLKLAEEAHDHLLGARLLANLSHQANFLGRFSEAVMYARASQSALRGRGTKTVETMCVMMEARGLASLADQRGAAAAIHRAEQLFEQRTGNEPTWISYYDPAELSGDAAHCFRDLRIAPQTTMFTAAALTPETPPRTRAFIQMVSAEAALFGGDLEEAGFLAAEAVKNGDGLQSARYIRYLADFRQALPRTAAGHPALEEFTHLLKTTYPELAA